MKILMAASECTPFIKVGGLADVVGTLPGHFKAKNHDVRIIIPKYRKIDDGKFELVTLPYKLLIPVANGRYELARMKEAKLGKVTVYFIENEKYFGRSEVYSTSEGDYMDNDERFIFFSRAVLEAAKALSFQPDIIHCHDWQTALIPAYLKTLYRIDAFYTKTKTVYTIHNIAYQGSFPKTTLPVTGLPESDFTWDKLEFYGSLNFMKIGLTYADMITTVSPTYAKEVLLTEEGRGMEGILNSRKNDFIGILNGISYDEWSPSRDLNISANFSKNDLSGKAKCKAELQLISGLPQDEKAMVVGTVSRLDPQKGFNLVVKAMPILAKENIQFIFLGSGDKNIFNALTALSKKYPNKISFTTGFNEPLAHKIYAGSDVFLMPSLFEPCGLGQMIALSYGTIPVVHKTGGLADSVSDFNTRTGFGNGFSFLKVDHDELACTIKFASKVFHDTKTWGKLVTNAFNSDFSWKKSINEYLKVYKRLGDV